jgi:hypothetical protein
VARSICSSRAVLDEENQPAMLQQDGNGQVCGMGRSDDGGWQDYSEKNRGEMVSMISGWVERGGTV